METATYAPPKLTNTAKNVLVGLTTCKERGGGEEKLTVASRHRGPDRSLRLPCLLRASQADGEEISSQETEEVKEDRVKEGGMRRLNSTGCTLACHGNNEVDTIDLFFSCQSHQQPLHCTPNSSCVP